MKKKEVKRFLKENPDFTSWVMKDSSRLSAIKANPDSVKEMYKQWSAPKKMIDFNAITQKTSRARDMLGNVQSIMELMSDHAKKQGFY